MIKQGMLKLLTYYLHVKLSSDICLVSNIVINLAYEAFSIVLISFECRKRKKLPKLMK